MVKAFKLLVVMLTTFCVFSINVMAGSSKFDPTINLLPEITNDQIVFVIGYTGEEIMAVSHKISWDSNYLSLVSVSQIPDFTVTSSNPLEDQEYRTISIVGDSDFSYLDTNYASVVFELTDKFVVGEKTEVIFYGYESAGLDVYKYKHRGYMLTLNRESRTKMVYFEKAIDDSIKTKFWFKENWLLLVVGGLFVVALLVIIMVMPTKRRKEQRERKIRQQAKDRSYNFGKNDYKVDHNKLDQISGINKEKDMSEAIVISDVNPFQYAEGTQRTVAGQEHNYGTVNPQGMGTVNVPQQPVQPQVVNAGVQLVDNLPVNNNPENLAQVYIPDQVLAPGQAQVQAPTFVSAPQQPVQEIPAQPKNEFDVGFDPFNMKLESSVPQVEATPQVQEVAPQQPVQNVPTPDVETDMFKEIDDKPVNNNNENLVLFQPQNFDSAHNPEKIETLVFALLFILASLVFPSSTNALNYEVDELRACIVGNIPRDEKYDYNKDGIIDVVDIIATKDLSNVTMESVGETHPGYISIEEYGFTTTRRPNFVSNTTRYTTTHPGFADVTTDSTDQTIQVGGDRTTTFATTSHISSSTKRTTNRSTTKAGSTTASKKTTTKRTTTTTSKKTTTKRTTTTTTTTSRTKTTTTAKGEFNIKFKAVNGTIDGGVTNITVKRGEGFEVGSKPNTGYSYYKLVCSYDLQALYNTSKQKIVGSEVYTNSTCTITYTLNSYKVTLKVIGNDISQSKTFTVDHGKNASYGFDGTYFTQKSYL